MKKIRKTALLTGSMSVLLISGLVAFVIVRKKANA